MNRTFLLVLGPSLLGLALSRPAPAQSTASLELQPVELHDDGRRVGAELGHLAVPMRHEAPEAGSIRLAVLVRRSTANEPGPPTFFLNGIPESAIGLATQKHWDAYLELGDVVLIDQRGAGRSEPALLWDRPPYRTERWLASREEALENLRATAATIRAFTDAVGVDLGAFNTRESACDVDAVRRALGYERIHLVGHSGGSHLGLEVVRRFGEHVERFVSLGTAGPNDIHSLPGEIDDFVRGIARLAAEDERPGARFPRLFERLSAVLERMEHEPIPFELRHPESGESVELRLGRHGLRFLLLLELGDPEDLALLPRLVHELEHGRADVLRWFVERRFHQLRDFPALVFVNRAASGATPERWKRIRREARRSPFGDVRCLFSPELDEVFGIRDLGDDFRAPVESQVPTLFVSATLDGKTPPARAEQARRGFPDSAHLVVENGGHNDLVTHPEVHDRILGFLAGDELRDDCIELTPLRFALLEGEDPLVSHPALD